MIWEAVTVMIDNRGRLALILTVIAVLAGAATSAARAEQSETINPNLVADPDGEAGLAGWTSSGWAVVPFGSSPSVPAAGYGSVAGFPNPHPYVFQAQRVGSTMTQDVSFARYTPEIEAGTEPVVVNVSLGGAGKEPGGAEMIVQPQDGGGNPLGSPVQLGPPTAADRKDQATLLSCRVTFIAPVSMRSVSVRIEAVGGSPGQPSSAMAKDVSLQDLEIRAAVGGPPEVPAQGPNCYVEGPPLSFADPAPVPLPSQDPPTATKKPRHLARRLTRAQKLAKALEACKRERGAEKQRACARAARARYPRPSSKLKTTRQPKYRHLQQQVATY